MIHYNEHGHIVETIWHKDKAIKSSIDTYDENGGMIKGRIDVGLKYWEDPNIIVHHFILHKSDGNHQVLTRVGINEALNFTADRETGVGYTGYFDRSSPTFAGLGIVYIELEYTNLNGWVEIYPKKPTSMKTAFEDNVRTVYAKMQPRRSFRVLTLVGQNYDDTDIDYDVPFGIENKVAWLNFDTSTYCTVKMQDAETLLVSGVSSLTFDKVWIRYK